MQNVEFAVQMNRICLSQSKCVRALNVKVSCAYVEHVVDLNSKLQTECICILYVCYKLEASYEYTVACDSTVALSFKSLKCMSALGFEIIKMILLFIING